MALLDLPVELFEQILHQLRHHDWAQLSRVSKPLQRMLEPLLWESIEFHTPHCHRERPQILPGGPKNDNWIHLKPEQSQERRHWDDQQLIKMGFRFLEVCQALRRDRPMRWKRLSGKVRSLCLTVKPQNREHDGHSYELEVRPVGADAWNTLLSFVNLEFLDVIAAHVDLPDAEPIEKDYVPLAKLRSLRLRGYVPQAFARRVYHLAPNLERLDLGVMDEPKGFNDWEGGSGTPPPYEGKEYWIPRPLVGIFDRGTHHSSKLSHVCLCKPSDPAETADVYIYDLQDMDRDVRALMEWAAMLNGIQGSVVELTLELRLPTSVWDGIEPDTMVEPDHDHPGSRRFHEFVVPTLLRGEWPKLRRLEFRGIYFPTDKMPGRRSKLEAQLPDVSVEIEAGKYMHFGGTEGYDISQGYNDDGLLPDFKYLE